MELLDSSGMEYSVVESKLDLKDGIFKAIREGIIHPLREARRICKTGDYVIHATDEMCGLFFPFLRGRKIVTVHHVVKKGEDRTWYRILWGILSSIAIRGSDEIIAVSNSTRDDVVECFSPESDITVVLNKISLDPSEVTRSERKPVALVVAEMIPRKNISASIEAFHLLVGMPGMDGFRMVLCGHGVLLDGMKALVSELGLGSYVDFVSNLSDDELGALYASSKVLLNTSLHEGVGMATLEAYSFGTPTFHLEEADIPKEVLVASIGCKDPKDMAEKVRKLVSDDSAYLRQSSICREAAEHFSRNFDEIMIGLYQS